GLRLGELLDLRWGDIDLTSKELIVRRSKTAAGVRTLPLIPEAVRVLKAHRRRQKVHALGGYLFPSPAGARRSPQRTRTTWSSILADAGVGHRCRNCGSTEKCSTAVRRFHSSRHTAATLLLEAGVELEVVSAILGHANIAVTAGIYAKVRSDLKRKGLAKLDDRPR
ncbi:MAG TPA: site-specific integrase, partial [Acidimicrobiales bacterium]|nr:site-specific integrase [Acidimicrobiales bacterium]